MLYFVDNNECLVTSDLCDQICVNQRGTYQCQCGEGYIAVDNRCRGKIYRYIMLYIYVLGVVYMY